MKTTARRILNLLLYLSACAMLGTGLLMAFRLVPGSQGGRGLEVLGWDRHQWGDLHTWIAYFFTVLLVAHLFLAWPWLKKVAAKGHLWRVIVGIAIGLAIVLGFLFLPMTHREGGRGRQENSRSDAANHSEARSRRFASKGVIAAGCLGDEAATRRSSGYPMAVIPL